MSDCSRFDLIQSLIDAYAQAEGFSPAALRAIPEPASDDERNEIVRFVDEDAETDAILALCGGYRRECGLPPRRHDRRSAGAVIRLGDHGAQLREARLGHRAMIVEIESWEPLVEREPIVETPALLKSNVIPFQPRRAQLASRRSLERDT